VEPLQHVDVPLEIELTDTVVRDRQPLRAGVGGKVEVLSLDGDQHVAVGLHDLQRDVEALRLLDGLVARDDVAVAVDEDSTARPEFAQGLGQGVAAEAGVSDVILLQFASLNFIPVFVGTVALMLTAANSFAPYAATGGHRLKLCLFVSVMMVISGMMLLTVPHIVRALFENIASTPTSSGADTIAAIPTTPP